MLICSVFTDRDEQFSKLIIQPEVTSGGEEIEIQLTPAQASEIKALEDISNERE
jgi:hypothetical protein